VSGPRNIPGITGTLRGMGGGLLARCRRLGQGTPLGVSSPGFGLAVLTANKKRPVLPASPRWRGAAGPGAVSGLRLRVTGGRVDAGLVRLLVLGAAFVALDALMVWSLCAVAARADDALGQR